jgi:hypothetical protein
MRSLIRAYKRSLTQAIEPASGPAIELVEIDEDDEPTLVFEPTIVSGPPAFLTPAEQLSDLAARVRRRTGGQT